MAGEPSSKSVIGLKPILALLISLGCLTFAILVIMPSLPLSWCLGFQLQQIVLGVLIGIQSICLQVVLPTAFVLLEARLGKSVIQNYDAILQNRILGGTHVNFAWRVFLLVFRLLPIGLGVAYKQFLGGMTSHGIPESEVASSNAQYGLGYPNLGQYASLSNSIFLSMNANSAFLNASRDDQGYPDDVNYPWAYGYNTLVLSQDSAALLDLPEADYIREIQGKLWKNETWHVNASVDAIVATRNGSIADLRNDTDFVTQTLTESYNPFAVQYLYETGTNLGFGWISVGGHKVGDAYCLMGEVSNDLTDLISFSNSASDSAFISFMESAQMFSIRRRACWAKWAITQSEVTLSEGQCFINDNESSAEPAPSSELLHDGQTSPYALDILPVLVNTLGPYTTTRPNSKWKTVSYSVAAANAWWARSAFLNFGTPEPDSLSNKYPEILYLPRNETIVSTRSTLRAVPALYVVVAVLPLVTLLAFIPLLVYYGVPVDRGFGLVSVLASINTDTLNLVKKAGLSGELEHPLKLEMSSVMKAGGDLEDVDGWISYSLVEPPTQGVRGSIRHRLKYG